MPDFDKDGTLCHLDWGRSGVERAATRGDLIIVVDTLSFSTTAITAVENGAVVYPCREDDDPHKLAQRVNAVVAVGRKEVPQRGRFSLSPLTCTEVESGTRIVLPSPNGATCVRVALGPSSRILIGALINARATATMAGKVAKPDCQSAGITVIACGERFKIPTADGTIRFALEDYLGAGAILSYIDSVKTPEARVCETAFIGNRDRLTDILLECESGQELREIGFGDDVRYASQLNRSDTIPILRDGVLTA
ncbi:MAG: 2-phosphosulfolactate phosphatase [candidate division Zixibacteria bacterium]|nr:2-phosphosulfolactate phosphatase [candidate division Zixibacteria bacterium]